LVSRLFTLMFCCAVSWLITSVWSAANKCAKNVPSAVNTKPATVKPVSSFEDVPESCGRIPPPISAVPSALSDPPKVVFQLFIGFVG